MKIKKHIWFLTLFFLCCLISFSFVACDTNSEVLNDNADSGNVDNGVINNEITDFEIAPADYSNAQEGEIKLLEYKGQEDVTNLEIPTEIDGQKVAQLGIRLFASSNLTKIENITIPDTVKQIGAEAFAGISSLISVRLGQQSLLTEINSKAFYNCENLVQFGATEGQLCLPTGVKNVDEFAFYGCAFSDINVNQSLSTVGDGAFSCIEGLVRITVNSQNQNYFALNDILYKNNGELVQYSIGKDDISFNVPVFDNGQQATVIKTYAFAGAKNLTSVNLNTVVSVMDYAFQGCQNLVEINNANSLGVLGLGVFNGTAFDSKTDEFLTIGRFLYRYNGTQATLQNTDFPSSVTKIATYAFRDKDNLQGVVLPLSIDYVQNNAFYGCDTLKFVQIQSDALPTINDFTFDGLGEGFKVYCQKRVIDALEPTQTLWFGLRNKLVPISTQAYFVDCDITVDFYLGSEITVPETRINGYFSLGWQEVDQNNQVLDTEYLNSNSIWTNTVSRVRYKANLVKIETYYLYFYNGSEIVGTLSVKAGDVLSVQKEGYSKNGVFTNFAHSSKMGNCAYKDYYDSAVKENVVISTFDSWLINDEKLPSGTWLDNYSSESLNVYAKWNPVEFTLTKNDGFGGVENIQVTYFDEITFDTPVKEGFSFVGWKDSETNEYISNLSGINKDMLIIAEWKAEE